MLCTEEIIQKVWEKGIVVPNNDPKHVRQDECGAWISRSDYGRHQFAFGWEINYIHSPTQKDGQAISNLRPMQWQNNLHKREGDTVCVIKAVGVKNCDIAPVKELKNITQ
jgi:hypothetical protein